jgi:branched-chain amino acid aminotransferase
MMTKAKAVGHYVNSILAAREARRGGYDEALMLDTDGFVSEASGENLFIVRDKVLYTSPLSSGILSGITRDTVSRIAQDLGYEVREQVIPREMLYIADELFFTGTAAEITPIRSVDRIAVGEGKPGPVTQAVQQQYLGIAKGMIPDRHRWLTMVHAPAGATR